MLASGTEVHVTRTEAAEVADAVIEAESNRLSVQYLRQIEDEVGPRHSISQ